MKERYIFFTLLTITLILLIGSAVNKKGKAEIGVEEKVLETKLKRYGRKELVLAEKTDIDKVQDLVAFSYYEGMLKRSLFVKVQPKRAKAASAEAAVMPVEDKTPTFVYKGKIAAGNRLVVIIEQTRSGETLMVSKGEGVDGYKVLDITNTEVILSKKGEENIVLKTIETP